MQIAPFLCCCWSCRTGWSFVCDSCACGANVHWSVSLSPPPPPDPGVSSVFIIGGAVVVAIVILILVLLSALFNILVCKKLHKNASESKRSQRSTHKNSLIPWNVCRHTLTGWTIVYIVSSALLVGPTHNKLIQAVQPHVIHLIEIVVPPPLCLLSLSS